MDFQKQASCVRVEVSSECSWCSQVRICEIYKNLHELGEIKLQTTEELYDRLTFAVLELLLALFPTEIRFYNHIMCLFAHLSPALLLQNFLTLWQLSPNFSRTHPSLEQGSSFQYQNTVGHRQTLRFTRLKCHLAYCCRCSMVDVPVQTGHLPGTAVSPQATAMEMANFSPCLLTLFG